MAANQSPINFYELLSVPPSATLDEIRAAYRARIAHYHPDRNRWTHATAVAALVNEAWEVLSNQERRRIYDAEVAFGAQRAEAGEEHSENDNRKATDTAPPVDPPPPPPPRQESKAPHREDGTSAIPPCPLCGDAKPWVRRPDGVERCWRCGFSFAEAVKINEEIVRVHKARSRRLRVITIAVSAAVFVSSFWLFGMLSDAGALPFVIGFFVFFAAGCILLAALVKGVQRVLRPFVARLFARFSSLPTSTVTFKKLYVDKPSNGFQWFLLFAFASQALALVVAFFVWMFGSRDVATFFGILGAPSMVVYVMSDRKVKPRWVVANALLRLLWWACWTLVAIIGAISACVLGYLGYQMVDTSIEQTSVKQVGIAIVILLIIIVRQLGTKNTPTNKVPGN